MYELHMIFQSLLLSIRIFLPQAIITYLVESMFCVIVSFPVFLCCFAFDVGLGDAIYSKR